MVRIKHRYLLVHILYPENFQPPNSQQQQPPNNNNNPRNNNLNIAPQHPLPSTLPDVVQFHRPTPDYVSPQVVIKAVREQIGELYGDYGGGVTGGVNVKYLSPSTSTLIIRCPRAHYRLVWGALTYMTHLPGQNQKATTAVRSEKGQGVVFRVVRVSGTIKKAEEEALRRARRDILRARRVVGGGLEDWGLEGVGEGEVIEDGGREGIEDGDEEEDSEEEDSEG